MKIVTATRDYNFSISGYIIREFKKNHSYVMSDVLMSDIMNIAGKTLFTAVRDLNSSIYKKYSGQDLNDKTIVIWRTGGMGDLCFITPYLKKIKEMYPRSKIVFGCGTQYSDVMMEHKYVDEFCNLPMDIEYLKNSDYHLMFEGIIEDNPDAANKNAYDLFGEYFGIQLEDYEKIPNLSVNSENLEYFKDIEKKMMFGGYNKDIIKIGIHIKTSSIIRDVPIDLWNKFINQMSNIFPNICFYIIGSQEDEELASKLFVPVDFKSKILPFYKFCRGFRDSVAAISEMDLILGGDSSGLHIAAAFKIPMIGLFGPFKSELRLKYYENAVGIDSKIKCSPCFLHGNQPCDNSNINGTSYCMMIFEVEKVIDEALLLLHLNKKITIDYLTPKSATLAAMILKDYYSQKENKDQDQETK